MTYRMFLDDVREPAWVYPDQDTSEWVVCRSFEEAEAVIGDLGWPTWISFDHDLGPSNERTGYDLAWHLVELDLDSKDMPSDFSFAVHSANPVGAENIRNLLDNYLAYKRA